MGLCMPRYSVLKSPNQMTWLLATVLLCAIQCKSGTYGFNPQFRQKPRLCTFSTPPLTSLFGGVTRKHSPLGFGRENFVMLNNPSPSVGGYGYVPWRETRSKLEVVRFTLPICAAVPSDKNSIGNLKPKTDISSTDLKKADNIVKSISYGESAKRSLAKAMLWRVVAGIVTLISGMVYSKNLATALSLVCSDFLSKAVFMFIGERLWSRVQWGQRKGGDSSQRRYSVYVLYETLFVAPVKGSTCRN